MAVQKVIVSGIKDDALRALIENFNDLLVKLDTAVVTGLPDDFASTLKIQDSLTNQDV